MSSTHRLIHLHTHTSIHAILHNSYFLTIRKRYIYKHYYKPMDLYKCLPEMSKEFYLIKNKDITFIDRFPVIYA